jgi:hypothetical protein
MPSYPADPVAHTHLAQARAEAQRVLSQSKSFARMSPAEQLELYRATVNAALARRTPGRSVGTAMSRAPLARGLEDPAPPPTMGGLTRDDVTNTRLDTLAQKGADFINQIDFPQFVTDLLEGIINTNLKLSIKQTEQYQKVLKIAQESLAKFISKIDDAESFAYLIDQHPDQFSMILDEEEKDEKGNPKPALADKEGNKLDLGDNEVKARIMDAKIAMAKEHRAMLRETILMGITRLVIEKGVVEAAVLFDVNAKETIQRQGKSGNQWEQTSATESGGGGVFGWIFGSGDETTRQTRKSQITVSSVKAISDSKLAAQIKGNVKIQFKTDYFKLDNFAKLYEGGGDGGASLGQIPGSAAVLPRPATGVPGTTGAAGATRTTG